MARDVWGNEIDPKYVENKVDDPKWGYELDKPVFVEHMADQFYLSHLRDANGKVIKWNRIGSCGSPKGVAGPTDGWNGVGTDGKKYSIFINWYGNETPKKAPKGLQYVEPDRKSPEELLKSAMRIVFVNLIAGGFKLLGAREVYEDCVNFICTKNNAMCLIAVEGTIDPATREVAKKRKEQLIAIAEEKKCKAYTAAVGFDFSVSEDRPKITFDGLVEVV